MANIAEFIDINDLVKTKRAYRDSGNGLLYSTIAFALGLNVLVMSPLMDLWFKRGVLMRTPENSFGQESHDNYTALGLLCLMQGETSIPRRVLWAAIKRFGFMYNVNPFAKETSWKERMDGVMIRFLNVWALLIAAAFPNKVVKYLSRMFLKAWYSVALKFQPTNYGNASGTQLTWLGLYAIGELGDPKPMKAFIDKLYADTGAGMRDLMLRNNYWEAGHPVLKNYTTFEEVLRPL